MRKQAQTINNIIITISILLLSAGFIACGNANGTDEIIGSEIIPADRRIPIEFTIADNYVSESYDIGNIAYAYTAASDGSTVYIFGSEDEPGGDDIKWALYVLDIGTLTEPEKLPYEMEPGKIAMSISLNHDDYIDLAIVEDANAVNEGRKSDISIRRISHDGTEEIFRIDISGDTFDNEYIFPQDLIIDAHNRIYLVIANFIYMWDMQGSLLNRITVNGDMPKLSLDFFGTDIYVSFSQAGQGKIARVDSESGSLGYSRDIAGVSTIYGLAPAPHNEILVASEQGIGIYDTTSNGLNEIFTWSSVDMAAGMLGMLLPLSEGRLGWLENKHNKAELQIIKPAHADEAHEDDVAEAVEKITLFLGGNIDNFAIEGLGEGITDFNKNNPHYRIEYQNYGSSNEDRFRFNMDIITGKAPDILLFDHRMSKSMELYAAKGALTDIYPFIDGNSSIERTDFYENILKAHEIDGKLLAMPLSFRIFSLSAPKSSVGDINSWTLDEMISYVDGLPPNTQVFQDNSKSGVLDICLFANSDALVDWSGEGSGFRRDLVLKMLNFADRFTPDEIYVHDEDYFRRIRDDQQMKLLPFRISHYIDIGRPEAYIGEPLSYPGYPSENGSGHIIEAFGALAINSNSEHKEGAWEFIRTMLKDEYQAEYNWYSSMGIPILKKGMEFKINEVTRYLGIWNNGISPMVQKLDIYGNTYETRTPTESDIKLMHDFINRADKVRNSDTQISNIVFEEAQLFFTGAKSAEETVDVMENRISLYVNELK